MQLVWDAHMFDREREREGGGKDALKLQAELFVHSHY